MYYKFKFPFPTYVQQPIRFIIVPIQRQPDLSIRVGRRRTCTKRKSWWPHGRNACVVTTLSQCLIEKLCDKARTAKFIFERFGGQNGHVIWVGRIFEIWAKVTGPIIAS